MERLVPGDLEAVSRLLEECSLLASDLKPGNLNQFAGVRQGSSFVAVGGIQAFGASGLLRSIAISKTLRGEGYGKKIVTRVEQIAAEDKISTLYLLTETAAEFFTRLDYQIIPRSQVPTAILSTPQFTDLCPDTAACMKKHLALNPLS